MKSLSACLQHFLVSFRNLSETHMPYLTGSGMQILSSRLPAAYFAASGKHTFGLLLLHGCHSRSVQSNASLAQLLSLLLRWQERSSAASSSRNCCLPC